MTSDKSKELKVKNKLAQRIKELRKEQGYNQKAFADKLGIKPTTYNGYESGLHEPNSDILTMIAEEFDVTIDYLLGVSDFKKLCIDDSESLTNDQLFLIFNYEKLNSIGKQQILEFIDIMVLSNKYSIDI